EVGNAPVQGNHRLVARSRFGDLGLAEDRSKPMVAFASERAGLGFAFEGSMDDGTQVSDLRKSDRATVEAPCLRMRFGKTEKVAPLAFPTRSFGGSLEAALPSLVELDEQLSADVARHVGQPRQLGAKLGQFVDLIEGGRKAPLVS